MFLLVITLWSYVAYNVKTIFLRTLSANIYFKPTFIKKYKPMYFNFQKEYLFLETLPWSVHHYGEIFKINGTIF